MASKYEEIEEREGRLMEDILIELYQIHGHEQRVQRIIAARLGVSQPTLSQWIKYLRLVPKTTLHRPETVREGGDREPVN